MKDVHQARPGAMAGSYQPTLTGLAQHRLRNCTPGDAACARAELILEGPSPRRYWTGPRGASPPGQGLGAGVPHTLLGQPFAALTDVRTISPILRSRSVSRVPVTASVNGPSDQLMALRSSRRMCFEPVS
jgi:hypothetical protein